MFTFAYPAAFTRDESGRICVAFPDFPTAHTDGATANQAREIGITQSELARRLKVRETVVRRMLDPNHDTRPEKIQSALEVLGRRVFMAYDDAA